MTKMCFNSANLQGTGAARKKAGGGTKGKGNRRAGYGRREVLTPPIPPHLQNGDVLCSRVSFGRCKVKGAAHCSQNKVKVENGQTQVLWTVVNENGDLMDEYFETMNLKEGYRRDCGEFIDRLKKSREKADISNKEGRCRKKP